MSRIHGVTDVIGMYHGGHWQMGHVMVHADTADQGFYMIYATQRFQ